MSAAPVNDDALAEPLRSRWSPTFFDDTQALDRAQVTTLLQAARWAPSAGNSQPWVFLVAERGSGTRAALEEHLSRGNAWVRRPAVVLLGCTQVGPDPAAPPSGKPAKDPAYAHHDLGQAAAHVTLQARAMGLDAHQFSGFDKDAVAAALGLPDHVRLLTGIAVGHRGDPAAAPEAEREREAKPRTRKPLDEVALVRWGEAW
ncbi:Protein DrgA [Nocardioides aquaticus]|uniref:Protein DrgA n=1 Tax=Nocardioides aquaticus TaxID=160826 RepID=A0ABX8ECV1_9ACTN|nr:nitroreductase family protein [Nocardioides aquaticus]QVT77705.1 Protein DrgA [Nocardioides aquaticus]